MGSTARRGMVVMFVAFSAGAEARADLCPGDTPPSKRSSITKQSETSVSISAQTGLVHWYDHPTCHGNGGSLAVTARLHNVFGFTGCESGDVGSHTSAYSDRHCGDLAAGTYTTVGLHSFAGHDLGTSESPNVTLAGPPPPPPPPELPPNECACSECGCSPLIVDLGGNGFNFSGPDDGVLFGLSGPLRMYWVGWPIQPDDRWLAMDRNGNGLIDDASELFGTATRLASGRLARHGYEALADLDGNADDWIDLQDAAYGNLLLWADVNRNGLSEPSELTTPASAGVAAFALRFQESNTTDEWGNRFALRSHARAVSPPRTLKVTDVYPATRPAP